jgi:hypothetical protein
MEMVQLSANQPRWKRYAAQSGYVYRYFFAGLSRQEPATESYEFVAALGPSFERRIVVSLHAGALAQWSRQNRTLTEVERYGIAKMTLLRVLDDAESPTSICPHVHPSAESISEICAELDL